MYQFEVRTDGLRTIDIVNRDTDAEVIQVPFHTGFLEAVCAAVDRLNVDSTIVTTQDAREGARSLRRLIPTEAEDDSSEPAFILRALPTS